MHMTQQQLEQLHQTIDWHDLFYHSRDSFPYELYYYKLFKKVPQFVTGPYNIDRPKLHTALQQTYSNQLVKCYEGNYISEENEKSIQSCAYAMTSEVVVGFMNSPFVCYSDLTPPEIIEQISKMFVECCIEEKDPIDTIYILNSAPHRGYYFEPFDIKNATLDLDLNYNDDLKPVDEVIVNRLSTPRDKGLVVLYGKPGTGKTSYIRYLIHKVEKRKLFIPPSLAEHIADPQFISLLNSYQDSILIIEDAENIIQQRHSLGSSAISNLLNLTDGLLSDCFSIQIICTFNSDISTIDKALLRKGRLIARYEFKELTREKAQQLAAHLGIQQTVNVPTTLADVYNYHETDFGDKKSSIGFAK